MAAIIPVSTDINLDEYWQFQPESIEWLYVMQKLKDSVMAKEADQHCLLGISSFDGTQTYLMKKKFYTATTIAKATGLPEDKLATYVGVIKLRAPKAIEGLPAATVQGWGTA